MKRARERRTDKIGQYIEVILGAVIVVLLGFLLLRYGLWQKEHEQIAAMVIPKESTEDDPDWERLRDINEDVVGFLQVPGTKVGEPIMQSKDASHPDWYLEHDLYGNQDVHGSIYLAFGQSLDFKNPCSILYGHNMKDGSMFAFLHRYKQEAFRNRHDTILVHTLQGKKTYQIKALVLRDERSLIEEKDIEAYVKKHAFWIKNNDYETDMPARVKHGKKGDDRELHSTWLALSTCDRKNQRLILFAREVVL